MRKEGRRPLQFDHIAVPRCPRSHVGIRLAGQVKDEEGETKDEDATDTIYVSRGGGALAPSTSGPLDSHSNSSSRIMIVIPAAASARRAINGSV